MTDLASWLLRRLDRDSFISVDQIWPQLIAEHVQGTDAEGTLIGTCATCVNSAWPCATLRLLALPYDDRRGYREDWRP